MSFSDDGDSVGELQGPERVLNHNDSSRTPEASRETPCDLNNTQSAISQNMVRQRCSDRRVAGIKTKNIRPGHVKALSPPYIIQTRSKVGRKSRGMKLLSKANLRLINDNATRDCDSGEGVAAIKTGFLTKGPRILKSL
jgi:hypothetical protein